MNRFSINEADSFRNYLESHMIHDGIFVEALYNQIAKTYTVSIDNVIWNDRLNFVFGGIHKFFAVHQSQSSYFCKDIINDMIILDKTKELPDYVSGYINDDDINHYLCFVLEIMSGWMIYIVSEEVIVK